MKKAVILFSGGLDSTTCLALAKSQGFICYALTFYYGQKHCAEVQAAKKIAAKFGAEHIEMELPIAAYKGSALTDPALAVPAYQVDNPDIPITYVPARNTIFLSFALGWAETLKANDIFIGVNAVDYSGYPDCRPEYIKTFQKLANLATKTGINCQNIILHTPLIHLSKAQTIQLGMQLGVNYADTVSCYQANNKGLACGYCDACVLRQKGFKEAKVLDQTSYI